MLPLDVLERPVDRSRDSLPSLLTVRADVAGLPAVSGAPQLRLKIRLLTAEGFHASIVVAIPGLPNLPLDLGTPVFVIADRILVESRPYGTVPVLFGLDAAHHQLYGWNVL